MFCPKCGIENPDNGKFCRVCGANLSNVLALVDGEILLNEGGVETDWAQLYGAKLKKDIENEMDSDYEFTNLYSSGIRNVILGMGFLVTSLFIKITPPSDGLLWILFMIPAFCLTASGVSRIIKSKGLQKIRETRATAFQQPTLYSNQPFNQLPPNQTEYVSPASSFTVKELVVPSVTEETTKHLKIANEK